MADPPLLSSGYSTCHPVILDRQPGRQVCLVCQHAFWENVHSTHCAFILGERNPTVHKDERCLLVCWCAHTCICVCGWYCNTQAPVFMIMLPCT